MDFLDPKKQKAHERRLTIGYIVIGLVLLLATTILLYQAFGYGIDRHGRVIQNGLVFVSSVPEGAEIYVNGKHKDNTNTRIALAAGQYVFEVRREGYNTWKRAITVEGGTLQRFDYPFLIPNQLDTSTVKQYPGAPGLVTQSLDRRWLFAQTGRDTFDLFDLDSSELEPDQFVIPAEVLSAGTTTVGWQEVEWAKDHRRVVLKRTFDRNGQQANEYILVDRENPAAAVNLSVTLGFTPTVLQLRDAAYDQYYAFDEPNGSLFTASLERPTPQPYLSNVLAFQSEGSNTVVYATDEKAPPGKTLIKIRQGDDRYTIRQVASDAAPYLLDLARFEGSRYVAVGAFGENKVYVYKNPVDALESDDGNVLVPIHILKTTKPSYVAFAPGSRFVVAESDSQFATYDAKTEKGYAYQLDIAVESTLGHAVWMDGYHLQTVSGGTVVIFDYDGTNQQSLATTTANIQPYFDRQYRTLYTITPSNALVGAELRAEQDR